MTPLVCNPATARYKEQEQKFGKFSTFTFPVPQIIPLFTKNLYSRFVPEL